MTRLQDSCVTTFARSHVRTFHGVAVNEWATNKRMSRAPAPPVARLHVCTFARSRSLRSGRAHGGGSARGAGTVPLQPALRGARPQGSVVSHVLRSTFARSRPLRSGRAHGGGSAQGAGTVPLQPALRGARPQGSVVSHVLRSHVRPFHVPTFARSTSTPYGETMPGGASGRGVRLSAVLPPARS